MPPAASAYQAEKLQEKAQTQVNTYSEVGKQGQFCASLFKYYSYSVVVVVNCVTHLSVAPLELQTFKVRRVAAFKKNLVELTELQLKHARVGEGTSSGRGTSSGSSASW